MGLQRVGYHWERTREQSNRQSTNNVTTVSSEWWRDSATGTHVSILQTPAPPFRLPGNIEQSSMCYPVGLCWLSVLNIAVCTCPSHTPQLSLPPILPHSTPGNHKLVLEICESVSVFNKLHFFQTAIIVIVAPFIEQSSLTALIWDTFLNVT